MIGMELLRILQVLHTELRCPSFNRCEKYLLYQLPDENCTYSSDKSVRTVQKKEIRRTVFAELEPKKRRSCLTGVVLYKRQQIQ